MSTPLSVEDILAKQKAEKEAAAKPKFLSKAERAKLALAKREAEVKEQQTKEVEGRKQHSELERAAEEEHRRTESSRYGRDRDYRERDYRDRNGLDYRDDRERDGRDGRYRDDRDGRDGRYRNGRSGSDRRGDDRRAGRGANGSESNGALSKTPAASAESELDTIKRRYLGQKETVKKPFLRKSNNKNIDFNWNANDDTSEEAVWRPGVNGVSTPGVDRSVVPSSVGSPAPGGEKFTDALERRRAGKGSNDDRHWSDKPLSEMKERDWRIFREDYSISSRGGNIPFPLRSWRESDILPAVLEVIDQIGYTEPSPIQRQAIPIGLQTRDLVGIAKTGSGKTAAFVVPMLSYIAKLPPLTDENRHLGPYALILAPTRELAQQIEAETQKFAKPMDLICVSIVGGRAVEEQQFNLRNGAHIIIATPGRLKDMVDKSMVVMSQCRYVVMDEADRMIDIGFEAELTFILDAMPAAKEKENGKTDRVMTLFSATMPPAVERLTRKYLCKPATVTIGNAGEAVDTVEQRVEFIHGEEKKKARLIDILRQGRHPPPIIVFVNQKSTADVVLKYVKEAGLPAVSLHSGKNQEQREAALQALRDGQVSVLVATDLAGRGIDVSDVSLVINWQMSDTIEKYVHRIGRTGRAGKDGTAITFLDNMDEEVMFDLKNEIAKSRKSTMNPELARHEAARQKVTREMKRKRDDDD